MIGYDRVAVFEVEAVRIDDLEDVFDLLDRSRRACRLVPDPRRAQARVRRPAEGAAPVRATARASRPVRRGPARLGRWSTSSTCPIPASIRLIRCWSAARCAWHLPAPFRVARCVSQLSSQAGLELGLRCHLWFMLDRPLVRAELSAGSRRVAGVDLQVFVAVQPHYTARAGLRRRRRSLPRKACLAARLRRGGGAGPAGSGPAARDVRADRHRHRHRHRQGRRAPRRTPPPACAASRSRPRAAGTRPASPSRCRLLALAKAGLLDPARVAAQIKGVMLGHGFDGRRPRPERDRSESLSGLGTPSSPRGSHGR